MQFAQFLKHMTGNKDNHDRKVGRKYIKINGCTRQFQCQQLFWSVCLLGIIVMYSIFVVPVFIKWTSPVLIVFMCIVYISVIIMCYDYFYLTIVDPVDPRIIAPLINDEQKLKLCSICEKEVAEKTFHCMRCLRCTYQLDHHSQMINNCISSKDIKNYIRMCACLTLILLLIAIESIFIFGISFSNGQVQSLIINKWVIVSLGFLCSISVVTTGYNLIFCIYINLYKNMERIAYLYREHESNNSQIQSTYKASSSHTSQRQIKKDAQPIQS